MMSGFSISQRSKQKKQKNLTIFVNLKGDYGNIYADVVVSLNPNGENPVTIKPAVIVSIKSREGKAVF